MRRLIALSYSPWSEKARWALDHHRVEYQYEEYLPMLGEPLLRYRTRRLTGRVTVPVLIDEGEVFGDSFEIASHAEQIGGGPRLFRHDPNDLERWNHESEWALAAGRALLVDRLRRHAAARREALPGFVPGPLRGVAAPMASMAMSFLARKYGFADESNLRVFEERLGKSLDALRRATERRPYVLGEFSYADLAMAVVLQMVKPVADEFIRLGPATREAWTHPELAERYADLVAWRDKLYAERRTGPRA